MTPLWWILAVVGALVLLLLFWFSYRALKLLRLRPAITEYLDVQSVEEALSVIDDHPELLTPDAGRFISSMLDRAWSRGRARFFVSGVLRASLLVACREYGMQAARRMAGGRMQVWMDAVDSPSWQRALDLLERLVVEEEAAISPEEVDEDIVGAMERILELLRPLAETEKTAALLEQVMRDLRQILREKADA